MFYGWLIMIMRGRALKKRKIFGGFILLLFLLGCGQGNESNAENKSFITAEFETIDNSKYAYKTELEEAEEKKQIQGLIDSTTEVYLSDAKQWNIWNSKFSAGVEECNSLFVISPGSGSIYFVNPWDNYFLYRIKDGKSEVAVSLPVMELCPYKDNIYFMLNAYNKYDVEGGTTGDIYCYSLSTGMVELVYGMPEIEGVSYHKLMVDENGIYFRYYAPVEEIRNDVPVVINKAHYYKLPFGEKQPVEDTKRYMLPGTDEYYLQLSTDPSDNKRKTALLSRSVGKEDAHYLFENQMYRYCVLDNVLYYIALDSPLVTALQLETGEKKVFDISEMLEKKFKRQNSSLNAEIEKDGSRAFLYDFVILNDGKYLWVANYDGLICIDTETMESICQERNSTRTYERLYTDGENLYVAYRANGTWNATVKLARVLENQLIEELEFDRATFELEDITGTN